ncbi:MAG: putative LPS assembly protein LptD [Candidatus Zixiibacteriota bacterium]
MDRHLASASHIIKAGARLATIAAILLLLSSRLVGAQETAEPLILERADSSEVIQSAAGSEYHLFGNVLFTQGETRLTSDRAVWIQETGEIEFEGQVEITQPDRFLRADHVWYRRETRSFLALGDVLVEDTAQSFSLKSERARFDRRRETARADSLPAMRWDFYLDSASQTIITADTLLFNRSLRQGIGIGTVRIYKGDWYAEGEYGESWPDSGRAFLTGTPRATGLGGDIAGDTLVLTFRENKVERVQAIGRANGVYRDSTGETAGTNRIRGQSADFFLRNDTLRAIRVVGEAYTNNEPSDTVSGHNQASGDSLWMRFEDGRLRTVTISGGARGTYRAASETGAGREDTVQYKGAEIVFTPDSNRIDIVNESQLQYGRVVLDAGRISYWTDSRNLVARPVEAPTDSAKELQRPHLADGEQIVIGDTLTYNIDSRRGRIRGSRTEFEGGFYRGDDFKKYTEDVFFVADGIYTTCDLEEPHFRFESDDMEILRDDKVIARPVVLKIGELPVAILPFYVFPIKRGRHSGFLPIRFGNFDRGNRFISNVGYYWAASDYWDVEGALDFNEESGLNLRSTFNYAKRYLYTGSLSGSYARESRFTSAGRSRSTVWTLTGNHNQTLSPTATLAGYMNFISDKSYYDNYTYDPNDRRLRTISSRLNLNKRFAWGASLTAALDATENLDTETRTQTLPQVSLTLPSQRLLKPDSGQTARWYHQGYVSMGSSFRHYYNRVPKSGDTTGAFDERRYMTMDHRAGISFPQTVLKHITVSPAASLQETWYYVFRTPLAVANGVPVEDPARRLSGSLGVGSNTNLYGFLNPRLFGLTTIRHTLTPSVSYSFTPAISQNNEIRSFTGAGGGSSRRAQSLSFGLGNVFDAKLGEGETERRVSLFNASLGASYDLEKSEGGWSLLSGSARTNLAQRLELSTNATWDLYNQTTGDLQWTNPRLLNFGISAGMNLKGEASALTSVTELREHANDTLFSSDQIPFNIGLSYRYDESRGTFSAYKTHWISTRIDFEPTKNWTASIQNRYDLANHKITDQTFEVTRDLHCWSAQFVWRPGGSGQGYYFRIGVKDIPDIKIERSESGLRGAIWR